MSTPDAQALPLLSRHQFIDWAWATSLARAVAWIAWPTLVLSTVAQFLSAWGDFMPYVVALLASRLLFGFGTGWPLAGARPKG